ncbi:MAG: 4-hydroxy-tetrahydrodipicolinate synthase [Lentisphaeria bacterium]|nr:4-hydroxy-tetrahydrodipicolinate synthase [Lentisphaeria bacterium]
MNFSGCYTAIVTPFVNGEVCWDTLKRLVDFQLAGNVSGIVPVGTTGESPTLEVDEHKKVIEKVIEQVNGQCTIIAGTGANSTNEAIELTKFAKAAGADATLQVTPYYNKPSQEGLYQHFLAVAEEGELPVMLYNVPGRSGVPIAIDTIVRLADHPMIASVKEAGGSVDRVSQLVNSCDLDILSGDDALALPMMSVGAKGLVSVSSNILPAEMQSLVEWANAGEFSKALQIHNQYYKFFNSMFIETNPIGIKTAMAMVGLIQEEFRLPICPPSIETREVIAAELKRVGLL